MSVTYQIVTLFLCPGPIHCASSDHLGPWPFFPQEPYFDQDFKKGLEQFQKWHVQVLDWREKLGCVGSLEVLRPWTGLRGRRYLGLKATSRVQAILDLVTIESLGGAQKTAALLQQAPEVYEPAIFKTMENVIVDVSQNPARKAYSNIDGIAKCMHTASVLYSFKRDGIILPCEQMLFQGHSRDIVYPRTMSQKAIHDLAGMGISLPCLGLIFSVLLVTTKLPG